ncbi:hypothetical protein PG993_011462 [Apiospora rasikravindrae]|uniref:Uncharacterized protein n=1 Tax=Apiospora rasikravindrae TaxID=990691 RepID=A0ABR1SE98_9PEZI
MSVLANHQRLAHVSRISQLETIAIPARPAAAASTAAATTTTTTATAATTRHKPNNKNKKKNSKAARRKRAKSAAAVPTATATATAAGAPQSPKQVDPSIRPVGDKDYNNNEADDDDDGFWSPPTSPLEQFPQYHRVATDIRISLLGPDPALEADSDEFKKQAKEIKKDLQRLTRYTRRQHSNPATLAEYSRLQLGPLPPSASASASALATQPEQSQQEHDQQEHQHQQQQMLPQQSVASPPPPQQQHPLSSPPQSPLQALAELQREHEFRQRFSVQEGRDFLTDFLRVHFASHRDVVAIRRWPAKTLEEIKMIGNEEDVASGVRQCRRLFNAPVLSDRVGSLLYEELRQGADLDHSHEWWRLVTSDEDEEGEVGGGDGAKLHGAGGEGEDEHEMGRSRETKRKKRKKELPAPEELRRRREDDFERSKAQFIEMRELAAAAQVGHGNGHDTSPARCQCALLGGPWAGQATSMFGCVACSPPPPGGRSSVPNLDAMKTRRDRAALPPSSHAFAAGVDEAELFDPSWLIGARKSVDSGILSEVKRRTFRGAEKIAASLAAGYYQ